MSLKSRILALTAALGMYGGAASAQEAPRDDDAGAKNKQTEMTTTPKKQSVDVYGFSQEQIENNQKLWEHIKNNPDARKRFLDAYDNNFEAHKDSIMAVRWQKFNNAKEYIANLIAQFEHFRPRAYWDPKGKCWTVGYGNTIMPDGSRVTAACVITTPEQGLSMLLGHVEKDANRILEHIPLELAKCDQEVAAIFSGCYNFGTGPFVGKDGKRTTLTEDAICFFSLRTEGAKEAFAERFRAHCKSSGKREQVLYNRRCFEEGLLGYIDQTGDFVICTVPLEQLKYSQLGSVYAAKGDPSLMASIYQDKYCGEGGMRRAVNEQLSQMDRRHTYAASKQSVRKAQAKAEKYAAKKKNKSSGAKSTAKTGSKASKPTNSSAPKSKMRTQARGGRGGR